MASPLYNEDNNILSLYSAALKLSQDPRAQLGHTALVSIALQHQRVGHTLVTEQHSNDTQHMTVESEFLSLAALLTLSHGHLHI